MPLPEPDRVVMMGPPDARLERLFGDGAPAFRAAFDLVPDPVGVLWAIRDADGAIADFQTGYSNPRWRG